MNFLFPAAFFLGSLALPILVLYLRRPSRRMLEFSSLLFWQRVLEREPHRKFLGRLRNPLSLILQLMILLLLLLALARPQESSSHSHRSTVVVLDMRARMQAPGVFQEALLAAQDVVSRLGPHDEVAILGMEGAPRIISSFSSDGKELRRKLSSLEPSDAGGNLDEALVRPLMLQRFAGSPVVLAFVSESGDAWFDDMNSKVSGRLTHVDAGRLMALIGRPNLTLVES